MPRNIRAKLPTTVDVARQAGVSPMTVSRVLSGYAHVAASTRKAVLAASRQLGYRPNLSAAMLRGGSSRSLAVIIPASGHAYHARLLTGVQIAAHAAGYHVLMLSNAKEAGAGQAAPQLDWSDFEFLLAWQVDGIIIAASVQRRILDRLATERVPLAFVDAPSAVRGALSVCTADFEGMREITRYVIDRGHRQIAFAGAGNAVFTSRERHRGFLAAMADASLPAQSAPVALINYHMSGGCQAARAWALGRLFNKVTAIICANDYIAIGAMHALRESGLRVPADVSVVGFAGDEIGAYLSPPLTTMRQPIEAIGRKAAQGLIQRMALPRRRSECIQLPAVLVERASVMTRQGQ